MVEVQWLPHLWTNPGWNCPLLGPGDQLLFGRQITRFLSLGHALQEFVERQEGCSWHVIRVVAATEAFVETAAVSRQRQAWEWRERPTQWDELRRRQVAEAREEQDARRLADAGQYRRERYTAWLAARETAAQKAKSERERTERERAERERAEAEERAQERAEAEERVKTEARAEERVQTEERAEERVQTEEGREREREAEKRAAERGGYEAACIGRYEALRLYPQVPPGCFASIGSTEEAASCCFWCRRHQPGRRLRAYFSLVDTTAGAPLVRVWGHTDSL